MSGSNRYITPLALVCVCLGVVPHLFTVEADSDLFWHLRVGLDILKERALAHSDPYSFATGERMWVNHEWFAHILWGKSFLAAGEKGLVLLRAVIVIALISALTVFAVRQSKFVAAPLLVIGLFISQVIIFYGNLRPTILTFLLLAILLWIITEARTGRTHLLYLLPPLFLLWVNLHGGFLLGYGLALFGLASIAFDGDGTRRKIDRATRMRCVTIALLSTFALLCNPYGIELVGFVVSELATQHPRIKEWNSISGAQFVAWAFFVCLPAAALFVSRDFSHRTLMTAFCISAFLAFRHNRFLILLVLIGTMMFFTLLPSAWRRLRREGDEAALRKIAAPVIVCCLIGVLPGALSELNLVRKFGPMLHVDAARFPVQAVEYLKANKVGAKLALPFDWGGFAIWHLVPPYQVAIDGRYASVYSTEYADEQLTASQTGDVRRFIGYLGADVALVPANSALVEGIRSQLEWRERYRDGVAVVFTPGELPEQE